MNPSLVFNVEAFFGMREIEGSLSLRSSMKPDTHRRILGCHLPWSKTDPKALGTWRHWGCVCGGEFHSPCAYCAWVRHDAHMRERFGDRIDDPEFPAFPDAEGKFVAKTVIAATAAAFAEKLNLPTVTTQGVNIYTAHYLRISGAVYLSSMGIEVWLLQLLFRCFNLKVQGSQKQLQRLY